MHVHSRQLAFTAVLLMLPVAYKGIYVRYRHSLFKSQKIMTNKNLLGLVARHSEVNLRVRVVSLTKETIRV